MSARRFAAVVRLTALWILGIVALLLGVLYAISLEWLFSGKVYADWQSILIFFIIWPAIVLAWTLIYALPPRLDK